MNAYKLMEVMPCSLANAELFAAPLTEAMDHFYIDTPKRQAVFLAQVAHESGSLKWVSETWGPTPQQMRYEPPSSLATTLGNTQPGDGSRYRGHGLIQVTGRANHRLMQATLRRAGYEDAPDFEAGPQLLCEPQWAAASAGAFWWARGLNTWADTDDFVSVTKRINGALNGIKERRVLWERAKGALA